MKYIALEKIGEYSKGDEVPVEQALVWEKMYLNSPVERVDSDSVPEEKVQEDPVPEKEIQEDPVPEEKATDEVSGDVILEDYLERNTNVVKKNVREDALSKDQFEKLLVLEKAGKNRKAVIKAIEGRLEEGAQ